jgi:hypothetical protein
VGNNIGRDRWVKKVSILGSILSSIIGMDRVVYRAIMMVMDTGVYDGLQLISMHIWVYISSILAIDSGTKKKASMMGTDIGV